MNNYGHFAGLARQYAKAQFLALPVTVTRTWSTRRAAAFIRNAYRNHIAYNAMGLVVMLPHGAAYAA
jgi:hypothetical protein